MVHVSKLIIPNIIHHLAQIYIDNPSVIQLSMHVGPGMLCSKLTRVYDAITICFKH